MKIYEGVAVRTVPDDQEFRGNYAPPEEIDEIEMAKWGVQGMTKEQSDEHGFFNTVRRRKKEKEKEEEEEEE